MVGEGVGQNNAVQHLERLVMPVKAHRHDVFIANAVLSAAYAIEPMSA